MTAYGTVETAVEAMKQGAYDFVTKPLKRAHVVRVVGKALEKQSLRAENRSLRAQLAAEKRRSLIGQSLAWRRTMEIVMQAAPSTATVLLLGESGTGKELLARAIHDNSPRAGGPFVPGQLRGAAREHPRGRAVRLREGRVHRRGPAPRRPLRAGRRRHAVPRRDRRDPDARPGQAAARAAGGRGRAARRADDEGRRAPGRGDQPGPARAPCARAASARTSTTGSTSSRCRSRRCATGATTSRCSPSTSCSSTPRATTAAVAGFSRAARRRAVALRLAGQRARAREHDRARGRAVARQRRSRWTICRGGPHGRRRAGRRAVADVRGRHAARGDRDGGSSTRRCATPAATSGSARSCSASRRARSTAASRKSAPSPIRPTSAQSDARRGDASEAAHRPLAGCCQIGSRPGGRGCVN